MSDTYWDNIDAEHYGYGINFAGKKLVAQLLGDKKDSILDAGCGNGLVYKGIKESGWQGKYKGIDYSHNFIDYCKKTYPEAEWELGDINKLNEADESYDVVLLFHCIEANNNYEKPIREALRVAKEKVIVVFWKGLHPSWEKDKVETLKPEGYTSQYSATKFFAFLKELGYRYAPWMEYYADEYRYNLYFLFDKKYRRIEGGGNP